jgi:hypothetical protein
MQSYQTLAARTRQSLMLVAPRRAKTAIKLLRREIAGHPLDFRLDNPYICLSSGLSLL